MFVVMDEMMRGATGGRHRENSPSPCGRGGRGGARRRGAERPFGEVPAYGVGNGRSGGAAGEPTKPV